MDHNDYEIYLYEGVSICSRCFNIENEEHLEYCLKNNKCFFFFKSENPPVILCEYCFMKLFFPGDQRQYIKI